MLKVQQNKMWGDLRSLTSTLPEILDRDFWGGFDNHFRQIVQTDDFKIYQGLISPLRDLTEDEILQATEIYQAARLYVARSICTRRVHVNWLGCVWTELGEDNTYLLHSTEHTHLNLQINQNPRVAIGRKMFFETLCLTSDDEVRIWDKTTTRKEIDSFFLLPANTLRVEDNFESYAAKLRETPLSK